VLRVLKIVLVNVVLTATLLVAIEGVSRLLVPTPMPQPLVADELEQWVGKREFHPLLFWRMTPSVDAEGSVVINRLGLRGPLPGPRQPDELRVLSLGESTTAALALPLDQAYSAVLERELAAREGRPVRVINAGTGGYSLAQGVTFARLHGFDLEPDLVLTYFGYNDFTRASFRSRRDANASGTSLGLTDLEVIRQRSRPLSRVQSWLQQRSNLVRWAAERKTPPEIRRAGRRRVPAEDRLVLYRELALMCRDRGARLVVLVPIYRDSARHEGFLRELGESHGFEVIDLPRLLDGELGERAPFFFDALHPRADLHQRIGVTIAAQLEDA